MRWKQTKFLDLFEFCKKSNIKAGDGVSAGKYRFFTSSNVQSKYFDIPNHSEQSLIFGTGGEASVHYCDTPFSTSTDCLVAKSKDDKKIFPKFIYYYLSGNMHLLKAGFKGAGLKHISKDFISNMSVPLPPLHIQKQIADVLDKADALRQKDQLLLKKYDELAQSIFYDMFGDPVKNEKGWQKNKLGPVCKQITDGTHFSPPSSEIGIPYITAKHLKKYGLDFYNNPTYISLEDHKIIYARCQPEQGDVLYIKDGATTGIAAINEYDFPFSMLSSLALIKPDNQLINNYYLKYWLNNPIVKNMYITEFMAGAAIQRFTLGKINQFSVNLPPINLQKNFGEKIKNIEDQIKGVRTTVKESTQLFGRISNQFFT